jgi:hypothetical protein
VVPAGGLPQRQVGCSIRDIAPVGGGFSPRRPRHAAHASSGCQCPNTTGCYTLAATAMMCLRFAALLLQISGRWLQKWGDSSCQGCMKRGLTAERMDMLHRSCVCSRISARHAHWNACEARHICLERRPIYCCCSLTLPVRCLLRRTQHRSWDSLVIRSQRPRLLHQQRGQTPPCPCKAAGCGRRRAAQHRTTYYLLRSRRTHTLSNGGSSKGGSSSSSSNSSGSSREHGFCRSHAPSGHSEAHGSY